MIVSEIMTAQPITIKPERSVNDALNIMLEIRCHHLPVISNKDHLIGLVSDYECHQALSIHQTSTATRAELERSQNVPVREVMTVAPAVIAPEASVIEAAKLMFTNNIRCLPVMRDETLVGIITTSDLLIAFINIHQNGTVLSTHLVEKGLDFLRP